MNILKINMSSYVYRQEIRYRIAVFNAILGHKRMVDQSVIEEIARTIVILYR